MAFAFTELIVENGQASAGGGDTAGSVRIRNAVRRFIVPGNTPALAALNTDLLADAGAGVAYPGIPGLVSIGYQIGDRVGPDASGDVAYYAEVQYAPAGTPQFDYPPPDLQKLGLVSAGFQQFDKTIDFPIYAKQTVASPGGAATSVTAWVKIESKSIVVKGVAFTIDFNTAQLGPAELDTVFNQMNNLHYFYNAYWIFKPQRADKIFRDGVWNVLFRWEAERGNGTTDLAEMRADPLFCEIENRPSHAEWYVVWTYPGGAGTQGIPKLIAKRMHTVVAAGYQTLPGYGTAWNL